MFTKAAMAAARAVAALAIVSGLTALLSACAAGERRVAETVWSKGNQYVRVEFQDSFGGGPPPPNSHPVRFPPERIVDGLGLIAVRDTPAGSVRPLFSRRSLERLGPGLAEALARARPNQDATFAVEEWEPGFLGLDEPKVVSGRVFYAQGWLNLIFGSVLRDGEVGKARTIYDLVRNPYTPGRRSVSVRQPVILWAPANSGVYTMPGVDRADWLLLGPQALVPRQPTGAPASPGAR